MSGRRMSGTSRAFSQTFRELRFALGNQGKDGKNLDSQSWPGTPRRPSPRHPRPPEPRSFYSQESFREITLNYIKLPQIMLTYAKCLGVLLPRPFVAKNRFGKLPKITLNYARLR